MDLGLDEKIELVTGGSSRIGRAIVETFAREGATAVILARSEDTDVDSRQRPIAHDGIRQICDES